MNVVQTIFSPLPTTSSISCCIFFCTSGWQVANSITQLRVIREVSVPAGRRRESMMTSSNGNIFRVTGPLCGEFTGHRWISHTEVSDEELWWYLWSVNNIEAAGDLRRHRAHYDVTVMIRVHCVSKYRSVAHISQRTSPISQNAPFD